MFFHLVLSFRSWFFSFSLSLSLCELFGFWTQFSSPFASVVISWISLLESFSLSFLVSSSSSFLNNAGPPISSLTPFSHHHHHHTSDPKVRSFLCFASPFVFHEVDLTGATSVWDDTWSNYWWKGEGRDLSLSWMDRDGSGKVSRGHYILWEIAENPTKNSSCKPFEFGYVLQQHRIGVYEHGRVLESTFISWKSTWNPT